ncbi:Hypothetical predicted protein [Cloeon dipterum]|uniref:Uncharacterized protein n=1 Tax=Cloeon dipterum TaxID=197152 RepID=A0A8S1CYZ5_9INSE|nr:Hypothetical predicted protein [Cloeon dipterum]
MFKTILALFALVAVAQCGVPLAARFAAVAPFATSYNAHAVTHSVAAAPVAAPIVAPAAYSALPYTAALPYAAYPYHTAAYTTLL